MRCNRLFAHRRGVILHPVQPEAGDLKEHHKRVLGDEPESLGGGLFSGVSRGAGRPVTAPLQPVTVPQAVVEAGSPAAELGRKAVNCVIRAEVVIMVRYDDWSFWRSVGIARSIRTYYGSPCETAP